MPKNHAGSGAAKKSAPSKNEPARGENVDKIRDILFGDQIREYEARFEQLDRTLSQEIASFREETAARHAALEEKIKSEAETRTERQSAEQNERTQAVKTLAAELKQSGKELNRRLDELNAQLERTRSDLEQQISALANRTGEDLTARSQEQTNALAREAAELRRQLTDREALADLFTEISGKLRVDSGAPKD